jgi:hypothetical protein
MNFFDFMHRCLVATVMLPLQSNWHARSGQIMIQLVICVFVLLVAFNSYRVAKRQGQWSWPKFLIVIAALVALSLVIVPLLTMPWVKDKPGLATLIVVGLIFLFVGALVFFLRKFPPKRSAP